MQDQSQDISEGEQVTDEDAFWLEVGKSWVKGAYDRVEEAAKQLVSITSALQVIYSAAISFSDLKKAFVIQGWQVWILVVLFVIPIIFWLISLYFAVRVIVPVARETIFISPEYMKNLYLVNIRDRYRFLKYARWALILGFIPLLFNVVFYLVWVNVSK